MAPQKPSAKPSATALRHARITSAIHPLAPPKTFRPNASTTDSFLSTKRDKRTIKHSAFISRVASSSSKISKSKTRRRSTKTKSSATLNSLDSLADALPELADGEGAAEVLDGKIKHQSLRSKRGALKRKERLLRGEMARFGVSMAQLSTVKPAAPAQSQGAAMFNNSTVAEKKTEEEAKQPAPAAASNRWAALRGYISATMEQNPAFVNKA